MLLNQVAKPRPSLSVVKVLFGFFVECYINPRRLFNAKTNLVEELQMYY